MTSSHQHEAVGPKGMLSRICLNLIVKNEAKVIERCLRSAIPFLTSYAICDTGSTDDTIQIIQRVMREAGIPGRVYEDEWVDFGHNRTLALRHGEEVCQETQSTHLMFFDADEQLSFDMKTRPQENWTWGDYLGDFYIQKAKEDIDAALYPSKSGRPMFALINTSYGNIQYRRGFLIEVQKPEVPVEQRWRWVGVRHEFLECPGGSDNVHVGDAIALWVNTDGARSKDPDKFLHDAEALRLDLKRDPTNSRTLFYMAQSYRDAGRDELAGEAYEDRGNMENTWIEERYIAYLNAARCYGRLQQTDRKIELLHKAINCLPNRMEAQVELIQHYRAKFQWELARLYASAAYVAVENETAAKQGLFWVKEDHGFLPVELFYLSLYYSGQKQTAKDVLTRFLHSIELKAERYQYVTADTVERLRGNLKFHQ